MFQEFTAKVKAITRRYTRAASRQFRGTHLRPIISSIAIILILVLTSIGWIVGDRNHAAMAARPIQVSLADSSSPGRDVDVIRAKVSEMEAQKAAITRLANEIKRQEALRRWYAALRVIPYDYNAWMFVHNCEQPDTWHAGGKFGNGLPAGGNGLGISADAWQIAIGYAKSIYGVTLPASGWVASIHQQMQAGHSLVAGLGGGPACYHKWRMGT